jgi:hypothetical protein
MRRTAKFTRGERVYRPDVLDACLTSLDLGAHRETLERVLLRDHPRHLHLSVGHLPRTLAAADWRDGLGIFARNHDGELVDASRASSSSE